MLRFRLKELLAEREFNEGRVITLTEVAGATGVHRMTLSKIANHRGYNPTADVLDKLCNYFSCRIEQLVEHIPARQLTPVTTRRKKNASQRSK
jgi:DNA-binding Xre family transcriptional regulator